MPRTCCHTLRCAAAFALGFLTVALVPVPVSADRSDRLLEDFADFPHGWKIKDENPRAAEIYRLVTKEGEPYLAASVGAKPGVRVFKYVSWNTRTHPIVTWKWRLKAFPPEKRRSIAVYVSLHRDTFGIPTIVKYLWSTKEPVGTMRHGGFFGATEVVIESGPRADPDTWVTAHVDAAADFLRFYEQEPDAEGVGVGVLVGMELDADIADLRVSPRTPAE
jgi:hypothetical protein